MSRPRAVALVLEAADDLGPPDGASAGALDETTRHAWRDAAVVEAARRAWDRGDGADVRALAEALGPLLLTVPVDDGAGLRLGPVGVGERRRRGAFATPAGLAAVLADRAVDAGSRTVLDPACGPGALLRAAFGRLLRLGLAPGEALARLHGVDLDPVAVAVCRAVLAVDAVEAGAHCVPADLESAVVVGDGLEDGPGFAWAAAFPAVLDDPGRAAADPVTGWRGGFDAVLANPPWERLKVIGREWASAPDGLRAGRARAALAVRAGGRHPLTGAGEINAYLPFVETCWRLLAPGGRASVLVPAGVATDRSAGRLLTALVDAGALHRIQLLDPTAVSFEGVSDRLGVAVVDLAGPVAERVGAEVEVAVGVRDPAVLPAPRSWRITAAQLRRVNPNTGTLPVCAGPGEAALLLAAHDRWPVLLRRAADRSVVQNPWQVTLFTPLHMTHDARHFARAAGPGLLPLWEAKHAGLLDPAGGSRDSPRYWVPETLVAQRFGDLWARGWLAGYRNVTTAQAPRTLLPTPLPLVGVGNSLPLLSAPRLPLLLAGLASLPVDFLARCKHAGANLNFFKLEQVPLPEPAAYDIPAPWQPGTTIGDWVLERFAAAVTWRAGLDALLVELGLPGPPVDDEPARAQARADLDAVHAVLLGWSRADLELVLATFPALRRREEAEHGRFLTAERVLAAHERLAPGTAAS